MRGRTPVHERFITATAGHPPGRGGQVHEETICAERVVKMAKEAARARFAHHDSVSSASEPSWNQEPTGGFLSAGGGELDQSETSDLIVGKQSAAGWQSVAGHWAEPSALDQIRLETSDAPGGGTEQRGELLPGHERMARDHGEDLVDLAWQALVVLVTIAGQPGLAGEHAGTQGSVVGAARHLLQQRLPRLRPPGGGAWRGRDADDQDWLILFLNEHRATHVDERLQRGPVAGQWRGADVW